ncbi:SDR family NAD(P)-dependent oxidoreductase [Rouxiella sp. WC2420]|uniref:SDR family NAD(P)-dependent oxidoreductase n=1 Tax=Rouxiella sp. WC2420 TaxID=3234145 RepID=A0AB39VLG1_9GAMM
MKEDKTMGRLNGQVAIITGAAQGMGESHARRFIDEGAKVVLTDLNSKCSGLADELGRNALFIQHDVTHSDEWEAVVKQTEAAFGNITILVNNAGILGPIAKTAEIDEKAFKKVCDINQTAVYLGMKAVIPSMQKAGHGSIVNISSIAGIAANYGFPSLAYVGSKFAVRGMTKATAIEYGPENIRVNSVHPGFIKTPMMVEGTNETGGDALALIPLGRLAEASEVTNLVLFLASTESSYITGAEHLVDAGMLAQ